MLWKMILNYIQKKKLKEKAKNTVKKQYRYLDLYIISWKIRIIIEYVLIFYRSTTQAPGFHKAVIFMVIINLVIYIIFGIDEDKISYNKREYLFTKISRTLELYTDEAKHYCTSIQDLLPNTIKTVAFTGVYYRKQTRDILDCYLINI